MRRALLLAAAMTIPVSGAATVALGGVAGAAGAKITCTSLTGSAATTVTIGGCTGGNTGGSSVAMNGTLLALGGVVHWVSGSTSTFAAPTLTPTSAKRCADPLGTALKASTVVTADTGDGIKIPGKAKGTVCLARSGAVSIHGVFKIS